MSLASSPSESFSADLLQRVEDLEQQIQRRSVIVPIQDLAPARVEVIQPILAVVQDEDGTFVASFVDANINASGESQLDAVEMLKDVIASSFQLFHNKEAVLGEEPTRQLAVLRHFLRMP
jgi:predicted RNase H-like HicB family nuclease